MRQGIERRHSSVLTDEQLQEISDRVAYKISDDPPDDLLAAINKRQEELFYEWVGRKLVWLFLLLAGVGVLGAWSFVKILEAKGVI